MRLREDFWTNLVSNPYFILQSKPGKSDYELVFSESSNISRKLRVSFIRGRTPTTQGLRSEVKRNRRVFVEARADRANKKAFRKNKNWVRDISSFQPH